MRISYHYSRFSFEQLHILNKRISEAETKIENINRKAIDINFQRFIRLILHPYVQKTFITTITQLGAKRSTPKKDW